MASTSDSSGPRHVPSTGGTKTEHGTKDGPGTFSDAVSEFEAVATKLPAEPVPDPYVAVAYALGWAVGDALTCTEYQIFNHLVQVPLLDTPAAQWKLLVQQIRSRCGHLNDHLNSTKADLNLNNALGTAGKLLQKPPPGEAGGAGNEEAMGLHTDILSVLWPVASPLAKSYQLGHQMQQMCTTPLAEASARVNAPPKPTTVTASVKTYSAEVHRLLTALASKLPSNAAHATDNSLRLWSTSLSVDGGEEKPEDLLTQGQRWHDVLAGEVLGKDGLRLTDYVAAADSVAGKLWQTAKQVAARFKVGLIIAILLAAGGIALLIWGAKGAIGAGIATLLATFGLTWKGIGEFFGRAAANGEEELWNAEIDWAIAYRFTILKKAPDNGKLKALSKMPGMDKPTIEHMRRYNQWKKNSPDVLTS